MNQNECCLWTNFEKTQGLTAELWGMYIDMVLVLKQYIRAERAGLWQQHLQEVENMLPYTVSSGHGKYMSCLIIYLNTCAVLWLVHQKCTVNSNQVNSMCTRLVATSMGYGPILPWNKPTIRRERQAFLRASPKQNLLERSVLKRCHS